MGFYQLPGATGVSQALQEKADTNSVLHRRRQSSVLIDEIMYAGFPTAVQVGTISLVFFETGTVHTDPGQLYLSRRMDASSDWETFQIELAGVPLTGHNLGVVIGANNRICVVYRSGMDLMTFHTMFTDDFGDTFTAGEELEAPSEHEFAIAWGKGVKLPSGKLLTPIYTGNYTTNIFSVRLLETTDNGASWDFNPIPIRVVDANAEPSYGEINETTLGIEEMGETDETTILFAITRSERWAGYHHSYRSTTGGTTPWTDIYTEDGEYTFGADNATSVEAFPVDALVDGEKTYAVAGVRAKTHLGFGGEPLYQVKYWEGKTAEVHSDPTKWSDPRIIYLPLANFKALPSDSAYPSLFKLPNGQIEIAIYDTSPNSVAGEAKRQRILTIPLLGNSLVDLFDTDDQVIPTGVETEVNFQYAALDSEKGFSGGVYTIKETGLYDWNAYAQGALSATGTYFELVIIAVDPGSEEGEDFAGAYEEIGRDCRPLSNSYLGLNYRHASGKHYCHAGWQIRVLAKHDAAGTLTILNSAYDTRVRLKGKLLNSY